MTAVMTPRTLADAVPMPNERVRTAVLVVGFALLTAAMAQVIIPLPFTPVPVTGQTFAVLLSGAALGMRRGAASQMLYIALGATGLPFYAEGTGGWTQATGSTGGYLVGFIVAAALVGRLAERGDDRRLVSATLAMLAGTLVILAFGATWLAHSVGVSAAEAIEMGVIPFLLGDIAKIAFAGAALPTAWRFVNRGN